MSIEISNVWGQAKKDISDAIENLQKDVTAISEFVSVPEIIVTTRFEGSEITCTSPDGSLINGEVSGTNVKFKLSDYGVYLITSVYEGYTQTKSVDVTVCQQYPISIEYYSDIFSENSWETIIDFCQRDVVPETWQVGDTKKLFTVNNIGKEISEINIMILAKHHDKYEDNVHTAPITFIAQKYGYYFWNYVKYADWCMEPTNDSNKFGWENCYARKALLSVINEDGCYNASNLIPSNIKQAIRQVIKTTSVGNKNNSLSNTLDPVWLLSATEYFGNGKDKAVDGEGVQYDYFKNGNKLSKPDNQIVLRSPSIVDTTSYCYVSYDADVQDNSKDSLYTRFSDTTFGSDDIYVGFCF